MTTSTLDQETPAPRTSTRHLTDDVLQSAEDAVLSNPASVGALPQGGDARGSLPRAQDAVLAYVARQPARSALMAAAAGALAAALLRSLINRRRNRPSA